MNFATKNEARYYFQNSNPSLHKNVKEFFEGASGKCQDFKITPLNDNRYKLEFFAPANNPGFGKRYIKVLDNNGKKISYKAYTIGLKGLIQMKEKIEK
ncbi:MAG: hypothetical protein ACRYGR_10330 [Janthinobacterium lividum]